MSFVVLVTSSLTGTCRQALAGGGPENVLLVVNSASAASQTVANYFQQIRAVSPANVMYLDWQGSEARTDINTFREKILLPVFKELSARGMAQQIDYIIYSSGFPYAINFSTEVPENLRTQQAFQFPEGSLTGLTYLFNPVMGKDAMVYSNLTTNRYMRLREKRDSAVYEIDVDNASGGIIPNKETIKDGFRRISKPEDETTIGSRGFHSWYGWGPKGELIESGGTRYMLSAMLGVTFGRGNKVDEIIKYLKTSAKADGTTPPGTIYFMDNNDVRSTTRRPGFPMAVEQLKKLGVNATVLQGDIPKGKRDVQGLLCGVAIFDWQRSGSTILPGAICENLTSYSACFEPIKPYTDQTQLSEFMRNGAAGSSGTVIEPFSIQNKFPHAMIQVHYARGCSLAESFYEAVYAPYQLLIVGDPLCRPWANIPIVKVAGAKNGDTLKGKVSLRPSATLPRPGGKVDRFELFVDGKRVDGCADREALDLDTAAFPDGEHEIRVVGIENSVIESQGRLIIPVHFDNYGKTIEFQVSPKDTVPAGSKITLTAKAPGSIGIAFYRNRRLVAKFAGEAGETTVDSRLFGEGPIALQAIGWGSKDPNEVGKHVISPRVDLIIESSSAGQ